MKKFVLSVVLLGASAMSFAQGTGPVYPGPRHTESHGGVYVGGNGGSSHRGGVYVGPTGYPGYGRHK